MTVEDYCADVKKSLDRDLDHLADTLGEAAVAVLLIGWIHLRVARNPALKDEVQGHLTAAAARADGPLN